MLATKIGIRNVVKLKVGKNVSAKKPLPKAASLCEAHVSNQSSL